MSFPPLFDNALHDLVSVGNNPLQLDPDPILYTINIHQISSIINFLKKEKKRRMITRSVVRTSGEEILTFRIFVSIISLLSQMDSVVLCVYVCE